MELTPQRRAARAGVAPPLPVPPKAEPNGDEQRRAEPKRKGTLPACLPGPARLGARQDRRRSDVMLGHYWVDTGMKTASTNID
ncbi:hypothetical protein GGTG_11273 [Gaeumannomyces tritici R3-111a-1]|uniref:Uncharacterized protein n=1 Tax=Gaeumannomyces tritici (strain R3-111a-1) TaxID=644352 RepID=J3PCQ5_GAET3|nr:hypothetical protein GGTG_11273 [Gaeumannomyces tritici R3-111a-1]EJT72025.1 hypothetical protein GGTG_11273 [Gaeumannomyces tritici R3-111a-1]